MRQLGEVQLQATGGCGSWLGMEWGKMRWSGDHLEIVSFWLAASISCIRLVPFLLNHPRVVLGPRGNLHRAQIGDLEPSMSLAPVPDRFLSLRQKLLRVRMQLGILVDCPKWGTVAELFDSRHGTHYQIQYNHRSFWYRVSVVPIILTCRTYHAKLVHWPPA